MLRRAGRTSSVVYQNEAEKRVPEALQQGLLGWELTDQKVTLIDGEHYVMHTHQLDFVLAAPMGIMDGLVCTMISQNDRLHTVGFCLANVKMFIF